MHTVGLAGVALTGVVATVGAISVDAATKYQSSMELLRTQTGATQAEVNRMSQSVLQLATQLPQSPQELAQGLYHVESAGKRGAVALNDLKVAAMGAAMGGANLEDTTNALIAADQSGIAGVKNMATAMGTLNGIVGAGNMRMQDLTQAMSSGILSTAKSFGVSLQSVGAALADMSDQGVPAQDAATRLQMTLNLMAAPTAKAAKALESVGLSTTSMAKDLRSPGGILAAVEDLKSHMDAAGLSAIQQAQLLSAAFGGGRQSGAIRVLIGNLDLLRQKQESVNQGAANFTQDWAAYQTTTAAQSAELKSSLQVLTIAIGEGLLPTLNRLLKTVSPVITAVALWASKNPGLASDILIVVGAVGALAASMLFLGPLVGALLSPAGAVLAVLGLLAGVALAVAAHFGLLGRGAQTIVDGVLSRLAGMVPQVVANLEALAGRVIAWAGEEAPRIAAQLVTWARAFVAWVEPMIPPAIAQLGALIGRLVAWIVQQVPRLAAQLLKWATAFVDWVSPQIPKLLNALLQLVTEASNWIANPGIPMFVRSLLKLAANLVTWVGPQVPKLLVALGELVARVDVWLATTAAPALLKAAVKLGAAIMSGVVGLLMGEQGEPGLLTDLATFVTQDLVPGIIGFAGQMLKAAEKIGQAFANGILDALKGLPAQVGGILSKIPGVSLLGNIVGGLGNLLGGGGQHLPTNVQSSTIRAYQTGGTVPGSGPQLAIVHGGETVLPPGAALSTASVGVTSASNTALSAQRAVTEATLKLKDAHERLALAEAASYKTIAARDKALMTANEALLRAEDGLKNAQDKLALANDKLTLAKQKALGTSGLTMNVGSSLAIPVGTPTGTAVSGTAATLTSPSYEIQVYLDSTPITNAVTKVLFKQIQRKAGPVVAGSAF